MIKQIILLGLALLCFLSCTNTVQNKQHHKSSASGFSKSSELQFTFLVFDKSATETFFSRYDQFDSENKQFIEDVNELKHSIFQNSLQGNFKSFKNHTDNPTKEDFEIAIDDLNRKYYESDDEYFEFCIQYLFFEHCLPKEIQHKWVQTIEGDFKFNETFMFLLRKKCKIIDKMIYGEIGCWDKKLEPIFYEQIYNEITPERAQQIKSILLKDSAFKDIRFRKDRDNFIYFLDQTIDSKWRLILTDWN